MRCRSRGLHPRLCATPTARRCRSPRATCSTRSTSLTASSSTTSEEAHHRLMRRRTRQDREGHPQGLPAGIPAYAPTRCASPSPRSPPGPRHKFELGRIEGYRNFCNKLWNASRYVLMNTEGTTVAPTAAHGIQRRRPLADRACSRSPRTSRPRSRTTLRSGLPALYGFTWHEYCDWYLNCPRWCSRSKAPAAAQRPPPHPGERAGDTAARPAPADAIHHRGDLAAVAPLAASSAPASCTSPTRAPTTAADIASIEEMSG